jgi:hypothetical protein
MTSRRSMLKWLSAAWLGGWWGLGQMGGALPAAAELPAGHPPADRAAANVVRGVGRFPHVLRPPGPRYRGLPGIPRPAADRHTSSLRMGNRRKPMSTAPFISARFAGIIANVRRYSLV